MQIITYFTKSTSNTCLHLTGLLYVLQREFTLTGKLFNILLCN